MGLTSALFCKEPLRQSLVGFWTEVAQLPSGALGKGDSGVAAPIAGITNERLLIGGGANFPRKPPWEGGEKYYHRNVYLYRKDGGALTLTDTLFLSVPLAYAASVTTAQGIAVIGGENRQGKTARCFLLAYDTAERVLKTTVLPDFPFVVANAAAAAVGTRIFVCGGEMADGVSDVLYQLDLAQAEPRWQSVDTLPYPISHTSLLSDGADILYVVGGRRQHPDRPSTIYNQLWAYQISTQQWRRLEDAPVPMAAGTALLLPDNAIWVFSTDEGKTFTRVEGLIHQINAAKSVSEKQALQAQKVQVLSQHPGFGKAVWRYDIARHKWEQKEDMPVSGAVTTSAIQWGDALYIPGGEIRAGVRTPRIIGACMGSETRR